MTTPRLTRSAALLKSAIESGDITRAQIASGLSTSQSALESYVCGDEVMPTSLQLSLALLVIKQSPRLAGRAHALQAQATAAMAFHDRTTPVHSGPPLGSSANRRSGK